MDKFSSSLHDATIGRNLKNIDKASSSRKLAEMMETKWVM